jgi:uncharacterized radical SAM superfamily protein
MKDVFHDPDECGKEGISSYLVSGGCDAKGVVPLGDNIELLAQLSRKHRVVAHTGLIIPDDAMAIAPYVHSASFNFIGDDATIREVYGLHRTVDDFIESYLGLKKHVKTFPHITIGLHEGKIEGEYNAVDILSRKGCEAIVFNVLIPTKGTIYAKATPPPVNDTVDVIRYAKEHMKHSEIYVGCMRPGGTYRRQFDTACIEAGIHRIVMPHNSARSTALDLGLVISRLEECCVL